MFAPVEVAWDIGADPDLKHVIRSGTAVARVEVAHSVHVEVDGTRARARLFLPLQDRRDAKRGGPSPYAARSPARTSPALKFAAAGCQLWEGGYYTAWRKVAEENLDFVFHYGDYIYEHGRVLVDATIGR